MDKFKNKYRIPTTRISGFRYAEGAYFVTICTAHRIHYFGEITNDKMQLSEIGKCAHRCLVDIPFHFPHVEVPVFTVMPNHIHAIIVIHELDADRYSSSTAKQNFNSPKVLADHSSQNRFGPQTKNLASVIRGFKIGVTKFTRYHHYPFGWQSRYYDHIIWNRDEMESITQYILNNVVQWNTDELNNPSSDYPHPVE